MSRDVAESLTFLLPTFISKDFMWGGECRWSVPRGGNDYTTCLFTVEEGSFEFQVSQRARKNVSCYHTATVVILQFLTWTSPSNILQMWIPAVWNVHTESYSWLIHPLNRASSLPALINTTGDFSLKSFHIAPAAPCGSDSFCSSAARSRVLLRSGCHLLLG